MSDTRFAPVDAPKREEKTAPPKRWRNRYLVRCTMGVTIGEAFYAQHDTFFGNVDFPSAEIAEQRALEFIDSPRWNPPLNPGDIEYLGPFATDGDAP